MGINLDKDDGVAENERAENKTHESKQLKPNNDTKYGDQRMNVSNLFHQGHPGQIIYISGDDQAVDQQTCGLATHTF